jgi:hypothetical protein
LDPLDTAVLLFVSGGLDLNLSRGLEEARADVVGLYDMYTSGDGARFTLILPEMSLEVLNVVFPEGASGTYLTKTYRGFGRSAGYSLRENAKRMRLRPWDMRDDTDPADIQVDLWLVAPVGDAMLHQKVTEPWTYEQEFIALPDLSRADGELIGNLYAQARA